MTPRSQTRDCYKLVVEAPHLVFWQSLAFAFLILDTTRDPDRSDVSLDPAEIGGCGTGRVGHCAVKAVGSGKADVREGLEIKFQSDKVYFSNCQEI